MSKTEAPNVFIDGNSTSSSSTKGNDAKPTTKKIPTKGTPLTSLDVSSLKLKAVPNGDKTGHFLRIVNQSNDQWIYTHTAAIPIKGPKTGSMEKKTTNFMILKFPKSSEDYAKLRSIASWVFRTAITECKKEVDQSPEDCEVDVGENGFERYPSWFTCGTKDDPVADPKDTTMGGTAIVSLENKADKAVFFFKGQEMDQEDVNMISDKWNLASVTLHVAYAWAAAKTVLTMKYYVTRVDFLDFNIPAEILPTPVDITTFAERGLKIGRPQPIKATAGRLAGFVVNFLSESVFQLPVLRMEAGTFGEGTQATTGLRVHFCVASPPKGSVPLSSDTNEPLFQAPSMEDSAAYTAVHKVHQLAWEALEPYRMMFDIPENEWKKKGMLPTRMFKRLRPAEKKVKNADGTQTKETVPNEFTLMMKMDQSTKFLDWTSGAGQPKAITLEDLKSTNNLASVTAQLNCVHISGDSKKQISVMITATQADIIRIDRSSFSAPSETDDFSLVRDPATEEAATQKLMALKAARNSSSLVSSPTPSTPHSLGTANAGFTIVDGFGGEDGLDDSSSISQLSPYSKRKAEAEAMTWDPKKARLGPEIWSSA